MPLASWFADRRWIAQFRNRFLAAVLAALTPSVASAATLIHSGNIQGELEPCGCRENPLGGLLRRAEWLERNQTQGPFLQVDAGDLLFASLPLDPDLKPQAELQAQVLLKILKLQGLGAVTPGEKDFALGVSAFQKLTRHSGIAFLAANLQVRRTGKRLLPASQIFSFPGRNGTKVRTAVIGVVSPQLNWPESLKVTPAFPAVQLELRRLKSKADQVLVLSHQEPEEDQRLAQKLSGVRVIVGAHSAGAAEVPTAHRASEDPSAPWLLQASLRNRHLGVWAEFDSSELQASGPQLDRYHVVPLSADWDRPVPDGPLTKPTFQAIQDFKNQLAVLATRATRITLEPKIIAPHPVQTFVRCFDCHETQAQFWLGTPHARAYEALHTRGQAFNRECLECHSVGLGKPGAFENPTQPGRLRKQPTNDAAWAAEDIRTFLKDLTSTVTVTSTQTQAEPAQRGVRLRRQDPALPPAQALAQVDRLWVSVQCENCHGPSGDHPFGASEALLRPTGLTCLKCHTPEQAPQWYKADGKPDADRLAAQVKAVACPAAPH